MRLSKNRILGFLTVSILIITVSNSTADDSARDRFLSEYPAAVESLRDFYGNLQMVVSTTDPIFEIKETQGSPEVILIENRLSKGEFHALRPFVRLDILDSPDGDARSIVAGPELAFIVKRGSGSSEYSIRKLTPRTNDENYKDFVMTVRGSVLPAVAPYGFENESYQEFLSEPGTQILSVEDDIRSDRHVIDVEWKKIIPKDDRRPFTTQTGRFTFLPDASWALQHLERVSEFTEEPSGRIVRPQINCEVEYEGEHGGFPLVKRVRMRKGRLLNVPEKVTEVVKLIPGPEPEEEFTLEAFGIRTDPAPEPVPVMYYLLALSAGCVLLVVVFRYLQRRSERSAEPA